MKKYFDEKRKVGSQKEAPFITIDKNTIIVEGYQGFKIDKNNLHIDYLKKINKFKYIEKILNNLKNDNNTITDIGCSSGLVSFVANNIGYNEIYSLDHDKEYIDIVNLICKELSLDKIKTNVFNFGDEINIKSDIVIMLALVHWIWSCTANFGSFDKIFKYINPVIDKYFIIEWVDSKSSAIQNFKHINFNKDIIKEEYNIENFEKSLKKNIGKIISKKEIEKDRIIYLIKKDIKNNNKT